MKEIFKIRKELFSKTRKFFHIAFFNESLYFIQIKQKFISFLVEKS